MLDWPGDCHLVLCFLVFECFSMFHVKHDVFTTTHLFHVKRCFCFTTSQGCQCVSRETQGGVVKLLVMVFENCFSCRCRGGGVSRETLVLNLIQLLGNVVQRLKALTCMTTF